MLKKLFCLAIVLACSFSVVFSYMPNTRFATIDEGEGRRLLFGCLQARISGKVDSPNILFFGSSRSGPFISRPLTSEIVSKFSQKEIVVTNFGITDGDPSLSYEFLELYLKNNPAPQIVYFEVLRIKKQSGTRSYLNRAFSSVASWSLTRNILLDHDDGRAGVFRGADFLSVIIDKQDKFLTKLLTREFAVSIDLKAENIWNKYGCSISKSPVYRDVTKNIRIDNQQKGLRIAKASFETQLRKLSETRPVSTKKPVSKAARNKLRVKTKYIDSLGENWESMNPHDWGFSTDAAKREIYYYKKALKLANDYGFKLVFFRPYGLREPEVSSRQVESFQSLTGGEVIIPPYNLAKLSFPYYQDPNHMGGRSKPAMSHWLAIDALKRLSD